MTLGDEGTEREECAEWRCLSLTDRIKGVITVKTFKARRVRNVDRPMLYRRPH